MKHTTNYEIVIFLEHLAPRAFRKRPQSFFTLLIVNPCIVGKSGNVGRYRMITQSGEADFGKILKLEDQLKIGSSDDTSNDGFAVIIILHDFPRK